MKYLIENLFFIIVTLVSLIYYVNAQQCSNIVTRENILSISPEKWKTYVSAFRTMALNGDLDQLAKIHNDHFAVIHDSPQFLLWHRYFLHDFETRLRQIDPSLALPYWDGAAEFTAPHTSRVFSESYFGGNGNPNNNYCVSSGIQANLSIGYPETRCLRRNFQGPNANSIAPWQSPAFITSIIQTSSSYDTFRQNLEHSLHNSMHFGIGGNVGDMISSWSPVDLLFYPHHANIDRIWSKWQNSEPQNMNLLDGLQRRPDGSFIQMNRNRPLAYYGIRTGQILDTRKPPLCYTYDDIVSSSARQQNMFEEQLRAKLSPLLLEQYFPKLLSSDKSAPLDFSNERSLSQSIDRPLPYPISLSPSMAKRMGFNLASVMDVQLRAHKFVHDMNQQFIQRTESAARSVESESVADNEEVEEESQED
ncbi:uncharacterized protein LOC107370381 [Tetranychus urticae]|uniref:Tyrosinase copper-binding domain-containing protein n=1 Tax=Tetranychus urticae TaxID=32264 RepID=T1L569_TETUR|nr:uncharacterized protein LOC107370381 [Tetranychus urticae]